MNILLLGSGGREHALAWKLAESDYCTQLWIGPGNPGTARHGKNVSLILTDFEGIGQFAIENKIQMVVCGPEDPLVNGLHDYFLSQPGLRSIKFVGPVRSGARLEGSKTFAKEFMVRHNVPTARYGSFGIHEQKEAESFIEEFTGPVVLKADGLAAGKGVIICSEKNEALKELSGIFHGNFGEAGKRVVIEEFLEGLEVSVLVLTDGENFLILPPAKDYKRIGEGETGSNTGGMGAVSPVPFANESFLEKTIARVIRPVLDGLKKESIPYKGVLYCGLMNVKGDPYVIEFNCRFGDPETEVILPMIKNDLVEIFVALSEGKLNQVKLDIDPRSWATVILASGGYPGKYDKGRKITGVENLGDGLIFHAGTVLDESGNLLTNGGRVMAITCAGESINDAINNANHLADQIHFEGKYYRKDIGFEFFATFGR